MYTRSMFALVCWWMFSISSMASPPDEARLLRFPTIHDDRIVFTYAGDLYTVSATGGVARRLTSHDGFEMFARFSPDGKWLAFTGQYDGNTEVFVMPSDGGVPRRLTFTATLPRDDVSDRMGPNNIVMGWKHDGKHIVFRSRMASFNDFIGQLYTVSIDGGLPEPLPLPRGGFCSYAPDDSKLVYNRVFREFRTWKRYRGGMADDLWVYDFKTKKTENLTNNPAQDIIPMWHGDRIYFLSDRDAQKRMNLYVYDLKTKTTEQLTHFKDFDIKFPSLGDKAIAFENGGYIYRFDLTTGESRKVSIRILEDDPGSRSAIVNVSRNVSSFDVSPDGKRALFGARGDVFTVPVKHGPTRDLTNTSGIHERGARWSPDGKTIAFISDATGEDEVHILPVNGPAASKPITSEADTYKYDVLWSPDSNKLLWSDKKLRLQFVDVATKIVKTVAQAKAWEIRDYVWSPDSKWIAFAQPEVSGPTRIYIYSVDTGKTFEVTDPWYDASQPTFSDDGKYLFFVSNRDFNPVYSRTEWNHVYLDMARIYMVTLAKKTPSPLEPTSDEAGEAPKPADNSKEPVTVKVDTNDLRDRVVNLPIATSNYRGLVSAGNALYYLRHGTRDARTSFHLFDLAQRKEIDLGVLDAYRLSGNHKKMIVLKDGHYGIIDLPKAAFTFENLNLSNMEMRLDHHEEWAQIFRESWRQMRDFFYDANMNGVDWKAMRARYEPLVSHVQHRADLTYIIGEMIAELNAGHCYVGGGEMPHLARVTTGLLGAQLTRDPATRYYKITKILEGANWDKRLRSPLTEIGVDVHPGDYILAVDSRPANEMNNVYESLLNTAGRQVTLKVNKKPELKGSRDVVVIPTDSEAELYYNAWVQANIRHVTEATHDKVGYLHVPDMLANGLNEFVKHFYPQLKKKALIIDVRGNGGGNVSPMLIERLRREIAMITIARNTAPNTDPDAMVYGPKVCLINEFSASDGDIFPYRFRQYKLGKLIGKRTWGGVIGIRGSLPILDGGFLNKPEFSRYDILGKQWIMEGHGVDPDIVVDNDPAKEYAGVDEQLDRAIAEILAELKTQEKTVPPPPPYPKK